MIHGIDIARAILAIRNDFSKAQGQRWILTDGRVYDWWDLASAWGSAPSAPTKSAQEAERHAIGSPSSPASAIGLSSQQHKATEVEEDRGPQPAWVRELMQDHGIRGLPRDVQSLGRALDSRDFWLTFGLNPWMTLFS